MFESAACLVYEHAVVFTRNKGIFVRAREPFSRNIVLFALVEGKKPCFYRDVKTRGWKLLEPGKASVVWLAAERLLHNGVHIVVQGSIESIMGI